MRPCHRAKAAQLAIKEGPAKLMIEREKVSLSYSKCLALMNRAQTNREIGSLWEQRVKRKRIERCQRVVVRNHAGPNSRLDALSLNLNSWVLKEYTKATIQINPEPLIDPQRAKRVKVLELESHTNLITIIELSKTMSPQKSATASCQLAMMNTFSLKRSSSLILARAPTSESSVFTRRRSSICAMLGKVDATLQFGRYKTHISST